MRKHKNKIIVGIIVASVLVLVFWWGGNAPGLRGWNSQESDNTNISQVQIEAPLKTPESDPIAESAQKAEYQVEAEQKAGDIPEKEANQSAAEENRPHKADDMPIPAEEKVILTQPVSEDAPFVIQNGDIRYSEENGMDINVATGNDKYQTEPVPEGKPMPMEPENAMISDKELTCTLSVRCDTILKNLAWLDKEKWELVPEDGILYAEQAVTFYEGESVFNLLVRESKRNKIHLEFENTPIYNSAYIKGIGNLYEFDCGELSGWMYKVNDWFPNYGCSRYQLQEGDKVEWVYTCDLGIDVGGNDSTRNGK